MILFLKILLAHILGDFVFQSQKSVKDKEKNKLKSPKLYLHLGIHLILLLIIFQFNFYYWKIFVFIITTHFIIDISKIYLQNKDNKISLFFADQLVHLLMILISLTLYKSFSYNLNESYFNFVLLLLICFLFLTFASSIIIKMIITQWNPEKDKKDDKSLAKAGRFIGILERFFVFIFIITNHWEAIGFLLAAKSVFRFGDLSASKDRRLTEYILIGTLLSFGIAILTGIFYQFIITFL